MVSATLGAVLGLTAMALAVMSRTGSSDDQDRPSEG